MTTSVSAVHCLCSLNGWVISQAPDEAVLMNQQQFLLTEPGMSLGKVPDIQYDYPMTTSVSALHYLCSPSGWVVSQTQDEAVLMYQQQFLLTEPGMSLGNVQDVKRWAYNTDVQGRNKVVLC